MSEGMMPRERITRGDIEAFKREVLEQSVLVPAREARVVLGGCSPRKLYQIMEAGHISGYNQSPRSKGLCFLASELRDYVRSIKIDRDKWRE